MFIHVLGHRDEVAADAAERAFHKSERAFASMRRYDLALKPQAALTRTRYQFFRAHIIVGLQLVGAHRVPATVMFARH